MCFPHAIVGAGWYLQPVIFGCPGCQYWYRHIQTRMRPSQRPQPASLLLTECLNLTLVWCCNLGFVQKLLMKQDWHPSADPVLQEKQCESSFATISIKSAPLGRVVSLSLLSNKLLLAPRMAERFGFLSLGSCISTRSDLDIKGMKFNVVSTKPVGFLSWPLGLHSVCGVLSLTAWSEAVGPLNYI